MKSPCSKMPLLILPGSGAGQPPQFGSERWRGAETSLYFRVCVCCGENQKVDLSPEIGGSRQ